LKAILSTTYTDNYFYFLPIVTWCWNKLDVDVICFMPENSFTDKFRLVNETMIKNCPSDNNAIAYFKAPEHKQATYAQCARLYAACLDLPEDEILITSDVDMAVFKVQPDYLGSFHIHGWDLTPPKQYPMCYIKGAVLSWRKAFGVNGRTYQQCLDDLLGGIECDHFRGNYWGKDQEEAWNKINNYPTVILEQRARPGTQFATHRVDRDDAYWRERVTTDLVDAHLWRPGYEPQNLSNLLELLQMMYPNDNFDWLINYTEKYRALL
jgi:hypothetical protein